MFHFYMPNFSDLPAEQGQHKIYAKLPPPISCRQASERFSPDPSRSFHGIPSGAPYKRAVAQHPPPVARTVIPSPVGGNGANLVSFQSHSSLIFVSFLSHFCLILVSFQSHSSLIFVLFLSYDFHIFIFTSYPLLTVRFLSHFQSWVGSENENVSKNK